MAGAEVVDELVECCGVVVLAESAVAEDESGGGGRAEPVGLESEETDGVVGGAADEVVFVDAGVVDGGAEVEAGLGGGDVEPGDVDVELFGEGVVALSVEGAGVAQVAVQVAVGDELGEGGLVEHRDAAAPVFDGGHGSEECVGECEPGDAEGGGEGLAGAAGVDDAVGVESLEGADGLAVVAELARRRRQNQIPSSSQ